MKKVIGIAPASIMGAPEESYMKNYYKLGNNYINRTVEAGCTPFGLAPSNNWLTEEALEMCDAFLVQGGVEFYPYHFQIIHHAVTHGKRYLGICLGSQLIYTYFKLRKVVEEQGYTGDLIKAICDYRSAHPSDSLVLRKASGHFNELPQKGGEDAAKHNVNIVPGTLLHHILGKDTVRIGSFHNYCTPETQTLLTVNAWSATDDVCVEGVEYKNHILGVQGHPEIDNLLPELFDFLAGKL